MCQHYGNGIERVTRPYNKLLGVVSLIVSAYRYIAITNLPIIAVFDEYLGQFLIDLNQIYRHSSVPKTRLRAFFQLLSSSGFRARRRRDFFVTLCLSRCSESHECLTLAYFGLINVFPVTLDVRRLKIEIFLSWAQPELKNMKITHFDPMRPRGSISTSAIHFIIKKNGFSSLGRCHRSAQPQDKIL